MKLIHDMAAFLRWLEEASNEEILARAEKAKAKKDEPGVSQEIKEDAERLLRRMGKELEDRGLKR